MNQMIVFMGIYAICMALKHLLKGWKKYMLGGSGKGRFSRLKVQRSGRFRLTYLLGSLPNLKCSKDIYCGWLNFKFLFQLSLDLLLTCFINTVA